MKTLKIGVFPHVKGIYFLPFYENIANLGYIKPLIWRKNIFPINACETIVHLSTRESSSKEAAVNDTTEGSLQQKTKSESINTVENHPDSLRTKN